MKELREFINKKHNNNIVQFKLGKINSEKGFNYSIDDYLFQTLLNNTKLKKNYESEYKLYNSYYDGDNVYNIYENGYEKHYKYLSEIRTEIDLDGVYDVEAKITNCQRLSRNSFELKDNYDKILYTKSICFCNNDYSIEFNKISGRILLNNIGEYNEINIIVNNKGADVKLPI